MARSFMAASVYISWFRFIAQLTFELFIPITGPGSVCLAQISPPPDSVNIIETTDPSTYDDPTIRQRWCLQMVSLPLVYYHPKPCLITLFRIHSTTSETQIHNQPTHKSRMFPLYQKHRPFPFAKAQPFPFLAWASTIHLYLHYNNP